MGPDGWRDFKIEAVGGVRLKLHGGLLFVEIKTDAGLVLFLFAGGGVMHFEIEDGTFFDEFAGAFGKIDFGRAGRPTDEEGVIGIVAALAGCADTDDDVMNNAGIAGLGNDAFNPGIFFERRFDFDVAIVEDAVGGNLLHLGERHDDVRDAESPVAGGWYRGFEWILPFPTRRALFDPAEERAGFVEAE